MNTTSKRARSSVGHRPGTPHRDASTPPAPAAPAQRVRPHPRGRRDPRTAHGRLR